jgi:hypothetical protein
VSTGTTRAAAGVDMEGACTGRRGSCATVDMSAMFSERAFSMDTFDMKLSERWWRWGLR